MDHILKANYILAEEANRISTRETPYFIIDDELSPEMKSYIKYEFKRIMNQINILAFNRECYYDYIILTYGYLFQDIVLKKSTQVFLTQLMNEFQRYGFDAEIVDQQGRPTDEEGPNLILHIKW